MAEVITMPRLSDTMTEGKVSKWHKKQGEMVKEGDVLAEIETDKAVQDFESECDGVLLYIGVQEGSKALVDSILAVIGEEREDISLLISKEDNLPKAKQEDSLVIPKDLQIINMPRLSDTMTEGRVVKWRKSVGEDVKEGDILAEIETDKAVQDFESEYNGTLLHQGVMEGDPSRVDEVLAIIGPAGTDISCYITKVISENGDPSGVQSPECNTQIKNSDKTEKNSVVLPFDKRISISPLARKIAKEKGLDIRFIDGTGDCGRIIKRDVENFKQVEKNPDVVIEKPSGILSENIEIPNSQVHNIIAKRLSESKFTAPHYYLMVEVDMDKAVEIRREINDLSENKISFNDIVVKAVSLALRKHRQVNSSWAGDTIVHHGDINIGIAVAIEDGLVVPVLRNADILSFEQISTSVRDLASRAKNKGLKANEMEGSTFSVSNLGMYGIEVFTSIINQPNSCILSVGSIVKKPVVKNGEIVIGNTMKLSLACDHRVVDGATGATFLQTLRGYLENPLAMLI